MADGYILSKVRIVLSAVFITIFAGSNTVLADDTEVFFGAGLSSASVRPNILFILDTSGSMGSTDGTGITRIDRMKTAVREIIDTSTNINVGMMRFNSKDGGGPILFPVTYIDEELCPNGICTHGESAGDVALSYRVTSSDGDATEDSASLQVSLNETDLSLFLSDSTTTRLVTRTYSTTSRSDYGEQRASDTPWAYSGSTWNSSWDLDSFWDGYEILWGLRYKNFNLPSNSQFINAFIRFQGSTSWSNNQGVVNAKIHGEDTDSARNFKNSRGYRVLDRNLTSASANWSIPLLNSSNGGTADTPDLSNILNEITSRPNFRSGQSEIAFIVKNNSSVTAADSLHRRHLYSPIAGSSREPVLHATYSEDVQDTKVVGLRFEDVKIPQGAQITGANLEFVSSGSQSSSTTARIYAHDISSSSPFSNSNGNISSRSKTSASTSWSIPSWGNRGTVQQSGDIKSVIQEVVNRNDWCGGNALSFILEGSGLRKAIAFDSDPDQAPVLKLTYDASQISSGGGCTTARSLSSISVGTDDVVERNSGQIVRTEEEIKIPMISSQDTISGFRFNDVRVPRNATITTANLTLTAHTGGSTSTSWVISGEQSANADPFSNTSQDLSNRTKVSTQIDWNALPNVSDGDSLESPNLKALITQITGNGGWNSGNSLALFIDRKSGTGDRIIKSFEKDPLKAAKLVIQYEVTPGTVPPDVQNQISYLTTRQKLHQVLDDMKLYGWTPIVKALYEGGAYYRGMPVHYGLERGFGSSKSSYNRVSYPSSYTGGTVVRSNSCTDGNLNSSACKSEKLIGNPTYVSPMTSSCQKNHMIVLTDGQPNQYGSLDPVTSLLGNSCVNRSGGTCGEELAHFFKNNDNSSTVNKTQDLTTHTVGFNFTSQWLKDVASAGGGGYYTANSASELTRVFNQIIGEALKVDTSFVAPAATVNQFNRLTHNNDIYLSLFKPDEKPTWSGNLKQYRLGGDPTRLVDADGNDAVDPTTGFFKDTARSFWSDTTDGSDVSKGGAANELELSGRKVFTYTGTNNNLAHSSNSLHENNGYITKQMLNVSGQSNAYFSNILKWARGVDINDENGDGRTNDIRKHMGDPLHSRPLNVRYSTSDSVLYMATNEGFLHAADSDDGSEVFSFIPKELLPNLEKFYENQPTTDHPYGLDGHLTSWKDKSTGKTYLYVGMRRGGNKYYALDITNKNAPKLEWIIDATTNADFVQLGQTWSKPIPTKVKIGGTERNVLVFAGGYDTNQDVVTVTTEDSIGNSIYMVDPVTGSLVWSAGNLTSSATEKFRDMNYSIPSTVTVVDINFDGLSDQMYLGDMGGQVWRFDIDNNASSSSSLVTGGVMAKLSSTGTQGARRFFYAPDVSLISEKGSSFISMSIGSGWRAHPLDENIQDRFYMIRSESVFSAPDGYGKDDGSGSYSVITESDLVDVTNDLSPDMTTGSGWMIRMERSGEKVLAESTTVNNQIIFTTFRTGAPPDACTPAMGSGATYIIDAKNGAATLNLDGQGTSTDLTKSDRVIDLANGGIPSEAVVLFPSDVNNGNGKSPVVMVGPEKVQGIDLGKLTQRTFWQNNPEGSD